MTAHPEPPEFDAFAADYDTALAEGLSASGEGKEYFATGRVAWLQRCLERLAFVPRTILDFGCGTGSSTPYLLALNPRATLLGVEVSSKSIQVARRIHRSERARFALVSEHTPAADVDLAFCNGVFHHIPPSERAQAVDYVRHCLRPGGLFAFWENNPWNPGTRYIMSRIPFDRDAIMLNCLAARRLLRKNGLTVVRTDFCFYFPRSLRILRGVEPFLACVPLGAQYLVLCRV